MSLQALACARPLTVYTLFHPDDLEAQEIAVELHERLRAPAPDLLAAGLGIPCLAICPDDWPKEAWSEKGFGTRAQAFLLPKKPFEHALLVVLGGAHLVADPTWVNAVVRLAPARVRDRDRVLLAPLVDAAPAMLHEVIGDRQTLPYASPADVDEPPALVRKARRDRVVRGVLVHALRRLRRDQTVRCVQVDPARRRRLRRTVGRWNWTKPQDPEKLTVFLSYARQDGHALARDLRRAVLEYGHLGAFWDVQDIHPGTSDWAGQLHTAVDDAAGVIAVMTDAFASRPWCRAEVARRRRWREKKVPDANDTQTAVWRRKPLVVLDATEEHWTEVLPELGGAPLIRHRSDDPTLAVRVLDRLLLDVLLEEVHARRAAYYAAKPKALGQTGETHIYASGPVDAAFAERVLKPGASGPAGSYLFHPGYGVLPYLAALTTDGSTVERLTGRVLPFRAIGGEAGSTKTKRYRRVPPAAESKSVVLLWREARADLRRFLVIAPQIDELILRFTDAVLASGRRVAWIKGQHSPQMHKRLRDLVRAWASVRGDLPDRAFKSVRGDPPDRALAAVVDPTATDRAAGLPAVATVRAVSELTAHAASDPKRQPPLAIVFGDAKATGLPEPWNVWTYDGQPAFNICFLLWRRRGWSAKRPQSSAKPSRWLQMNHQSPWRSSTALRRPVP